MLRNLWSGEDGQVVVESLALIAAVFLIVLGVLRMVTGISRLNRSRSQPSVILQK